MVSNTRTNKEGLICVCERGGERSNPVSKVVWIKSFLFGAAFAGGSNREEHRENTYSSSLTEANEPDDTTMGWIRLGPWRRLASSPSSPPRTISLQNFQRVDQQHQQQEQGTIAPETSLLETSPTPNNSTRRRRGWFVWVLLNLACLFLATAAALLVFRKPVSAYLQGTPFARKDNSHDRRTITEEGLTELPFLTGGRIVGEKGTIPRIEGADPSHWVRVVSPLSMHPAMYVPGDGMVYCPIAKVSEQTVSV